MRTRNLVAASAAVLVIVPAAAACGGSASSNGTSGAATVSSGGGTTTASGSAAGHSFTTQIASLSALLNQVSTLSGSAGSQQVASGLKRVRQQIPVVRGRLATTSFPSSVQAQKQQLMGFLDQWDADLSQAQSSASQGHTGLALQQARSSTYQDLKNLLSTVRGSMTG